MSVFICGEIQHFFKSKFKLKQESDKNAIRKITYFTWIDSLSSQKHCT